MSISKWLSRNSSSIMSLVACVGVAVTATLTYIGAVKSQGTIKEWTEEKHDELTTFEKVQASAKHLIPAAIAGAGTMFCIAKAQTINKEHIAAITAGAAGIAKVHDAYRKANIKVNGKEAHDNVMRELQAQKAEHSNITYGYLSQIGSMNSSISKEEFLFYDEITETYFTSSLAQVYEAITNLNRNFTMGYPEVDVSMWCDFLGIKNEKKDTRGWVLCDDYQWIDFDIQDPVEIEDGLEVITISSLQTPIENYLDYDWFGDVSS